jgi:hypothetical protein
MTVAELIEKLRAMPQDMRVVVNGYEGDFDEPHIIEGWADLTLIKWAIRTVAAIEIFI